MALITAHSSGVQRPIRAARAVPVFADPETTPPLVFFLARFHAVLVDARQQRPSGSGDLAGMVVSCHVDQRGLHHFSELGREAVRDRLDRLHNHRRVLGRDVPSLLRGRDRGQDRVEQLTAGRHPPRTQIPRPRHPRFRLSRTDPQQLHQQSGRAGRPIIAGNVALDDRGEQPMLHCGFGTASLLTRGQQTRSTPQPTSHPDPHRAAVIAGLMLGDRRGRLDCRRAQELIVPHDLDIRTGVRQKAGVNPAAPKKIVPPISDSPHRGR